MNGFGSGKAGEEGVTDAASHVLEKSGGDGHFSLNDFKNVSVGDGSAEVVGRHRAAEVGFDVEVNDKISSHGTLLREHAVVSEEAEGTEDDLHHCVFFHLRVAEEFAAEVVV